ncbi:hypothetical protein [Paenibacillus silvisoli]|uniref:hypothetical protein n=1 Tax=Paenibacillus silvisoli TaxID=3110539 RepID=UPI0028049C19|nr:hypothetical protein [Paenibacillus silvisoli]
MNRFSLRVRDASGWTMFIFGALAFLLGSAGLINADILLQLLGFEVIDRSTRAPGDYTLVFMTASSMASFNMGAYYMLAALKNVKSFYYWTVPFRLVTCTVFTLAAINEIAPMRFIGVGVWEGIGALATGLALFMEKKGS